MPQGIAPLTALIAGIALYGVHPAFPPYDTCMVAQPIDPEKPPGSSQSKKMNVIWEYQPGYAMGYNAEEQAGLHDMLGMLLYE